jgi:hypothetical protein
VADIDDANTFHAARGYTDWEALNIDEKNSALLRANDYIAIHYAIKPDLTETEQVRFAFGRFTLARALAADKTPLRATPAIKKEAKELQGMKKSVEYADTPVDPYPYVTAWLRPLAPVVIATQTVRMGRMVQG